MHRAPSDISQSAAGRAFRCFTLSVCCLGAQLQAQSLDDELPLPRWDADKPSIVGPVSEPGSQFNSLLPGDNFTLPTPAEPLGTLPSGPRLTDAPPTLMPGYGSLGPTDLSLFLHGSILDSSKNASTARQPTAAMSLRDLPADTLAALATDPANEYVMDPQDLIAEVPRQDLDRLLAFHASEARIRLYILVLDADQKLPADANLNALANGALTRQPSCLAVYPLGEPWRARFLMGGGVQQSVPAAQLTELAADCIQDAQQAEQNVEQLQRFAVRLSTRLFWLEKALSGTTQKMPASSLHEVAAANDPAFSRQVKTIQLWQTIALTLSAAALLALGWLSWRKITLKRPSSDSAIWLLPDHEPAPRLGGAFSGGVAACISYKH